MLKQNDTIDYCRREENLMAFMYDNDRSAQQHGLIVVYESLTKDQRKKVLELLPWTEEYDSNKRLADLVDAIHRVSNGK